MYLKHNHDKRQWIENQIPISVTPIPGNKSKLVPKLAISIKDAVIGLQRGTLTMTAKGIYDSVGEFLKDPYRMTKQERLDALRAFTSDRERLQNKLADLKAKSEQPQPEPQPQPAP